MHSPNYGTTHGGLRSSLEKDFNEGTLCELQVLGLLGRHLTWPWMIKLYTAADTEINHVDGINIVKELIETLKQMMQNSLLMIDQKISSDMILLWTM